ncbi:MAG: methyltransferase [Planctomycetes bacterium]|nr:methyltransferase [Planctomycetota bacterium]
MSHGGLTPVGRGGGAALGADEVARRLGSLVLVERRRGHRVAPEALAVAAFLRPRGGERVVDLGAGTGVLSLLAARAEPPPASVAAVERLAPLAELARRNAARNGLEGLIRVHERDLRTLGEGELAADLVLANPPFYAEGSGQPSSNPLAHAATHELAGGLVDFVAAARRCLVGPGRLVLVHAAERLAEVLATLAAAGLRPLRLRVLRRALGGAAHRTLIEAATGGEAASGLEVDEAGLDYRVFIRSGPRRA